ncbi:DUF2264 domain-containing protein [Halarchaeum sp. P4]|uniref:DUF2264 domain-containing protein n=1 Tax=Halarchaeum sp. P4 TaxID=3421639 RepID=UPI003EBA555D
MNPVEGNPLRTKADFERAVDQLYEPLTEHFSPGNARVRPVATDAFFPSVDAELEGFSRPLWGVTPRSVGGETAFADWERFRDGLRNGTDPDHEEYWGEPDDHSQKLVEMAGIGFALALAPEKVWEPLSAETQARVADWLTSINDATVPDCNWLFFRVVTNLGLRAVDAPHDWAATQDALDRLETFHQGDGWYTDGPADEPAPIDYYLPWAMQFYGVLYAELAGEADPARAARFRERAESFAEHYVHWFDAEGRAIPYGRSHTYRFAQAAFWGVLAYADLDPLPWGTIRGLWARNVRWWLDQPIFTDGGLLSVGYRYPTLKASEEYNSPNSPYWGMKAFLPLALPDDHPFWTAEEAPLPDLPDYTTQADPGKVLCRDADHLFALSRPADSVHSRENYAKFAYSARFGFSVASRAPGPGHAGHDSALALSLDGEQYRIPSGNEVTGTVDGTTITSRWEPWDGVSLTTWLAPALPWHVRVHRLETDRRVYSEEGGFALDRSVGRDESATHRTEDGVARARYPAGVSEITALEAERDPVVVAEDPNTNLYHPRTVVPTLRGDHGPGEHWFASAVAARPGVDAALDGRPAGVLADRGFTVTDPDGTTLLDCPLEPER